MQPLPGRMTRTSITRQPGGTAPPGVTPARSGQGAMACWLRWTLACWRMSRDEAPTFNV